MRRGRPKTECLCVCTCLRRAARAATQVYDGVFRPAGYRATQIGILGALAQVGTATVSTLAGETVTDRTTLARNLRLLEKKRLVCLEPGKDRRERRVGLTKLGGRVLKETRPAWARAQKRMIQRIGRERFERLLADLSEVVAVARS